MVVIMPFLASSGLAFSLVSRSSSHYSSRVTFSDLLLATRVAMNSRSSYDTVSNQALDIKYPNKLQTYIRRRQSRSKTRGVKVLLHKASSQLRRSKILLSEFVELYIENKSLLEDMMATA
jgi:biotin-(acetyl-CoA carboxylase) ligase